MDEAVRAVATLGLPGVLLVITMASTGLAGAAAITTALAFLGGPAGMLGGLTVLGVTGIISSLLAQGSVATVLGWIYLARLQNEPRQLLCNEINQLPVSCELKCQLRALIGCNCCH
jgi:hypothetical protein